MTGILESMKAQLDANTAAIAALQAAQSSPAATNAAYTADPFGSFGTPTSTPVAASAVQVPTNVTGEMITALIQPHVDNPTTKAALGAEMRAMGINALPEAQPHQFAEMYQRFATVIAAQGSAGAPAGASII